MTQGMTPHTLARSTRTVELSQLIEINDRLRALAGGGVTDERLGLAGTDVQPRWLDRAALQILSLPERRQGPTPVPGSALLRRLLAAGTPTVPYLYGVFGEPETGRRELPLPLHTEHLTAISTLLGLHHQRWGV